MTFKAEDTSLQRRRQRNSAVNENTFGQGQPGASMAGSLQLRTRSNVGTRPTAQSTGIHYMYWEDHVETKRVH